MTSATAKLWRILNGEDIAEARDCYKKSQEELEDSAARFIAAAELLTHRTERIWKADKRSQEQLDELAVMAKKDRDNG